MPLTQSQIADIKQLIQDTVRDIFNTEYLREIVDNVIKTSGVIELQDKVKQQEAEINSLKLECNRLKNTADKLDRQSRNKNLRVFGVPHARGENLEEKLLDVFRSKLRADIGAGDIDQCYRLKNSPNSNKPAPVFVRFSSYKCRDILLRDRKSLKGTNVVITEDLTTDVYGLFKAARRELGQRKVWTLNGRVFTKSNNIKVEIQSLDDVRNCRGNV